jgi:beta-lactamase superfamily II metal-dependent hydrolase
MGNQLLIRAYNVGCGDCIYVRIPDAGDGFHILIDCGKKGSDDLLHKVVGLLADDLPAGKIPGRKRLDLLVATHRHEDHIKGFNPEWFANIEVRNIWLSAAMDPEHPQAEGVNNLHQFAVHQMRALLDSGQALSPEVELLASLYGVSNEVADQTLMQKLPKINKIKPKYVHSGLKHRLKLPPDTAIHILAPEKDIDHYYLGEDVDNSLRGLQGIAAKPSPGAPTAAAESTSLPANISATDFRVLQSRMLSNALAFAAKDSSIQNNLSVVLLIEWRHRRLLFVGDAEWDREFKEGKDNGSWNVMWEKHRDGHLKAPLDFLKVGHHGSINATPPPREHATGSKPPASGGIYSLLDTILPVPPVGEAPTAQALISTEREFYDPIPDCRLLANLATRVSNTTNYAARFEQAGKDPKAVWATTKALKNKFFERFEQEFLSQPQPLRTDLEFALDGKNFVEVTIEP